MNRRINNEIPPLKSEKPIFSEKQELKAKWTYTNKDKLKNYQDPISKTEIEMTQAMSKLHELLKKNDIKLSLVVYPWPQQLKQNDENSRHVKMWKEFCYNRCYKFINFFPFFFQEKKTSSYLEVYRKYYFWNDIHFNEVGNKIIADRLLNEF